MSVVAITPSVTSLPCYGSQSRVAVGRAHMLTDTKLRQEPVAIMTWNEAKDRELIEWFKSRYPDAEVWTEEQYGNLGWTWWSGNDRHCADWCYDRRNNCVCGTSEILPGLLIGNLFSTHKTDGPKAVPGGAPHPTLTATHVVHIYDDTDPCGGKIFDHDLVFHVTESQGACEAMTAILPQCMAYIHQARQTPGAKVLVHCYAGVNRSVTVVAAYLLWAGYCVYADEALDFISAHHPPARPSQVNRQLLRAIAMLPYFRAPA